MQRWLSAAVLRVLAVSRRAGRRTIAAVDRIWNAIGSRVSSRHLVGDAALALVIVGYLAVNVARTSLDAGIQKIHPIRVAGVSTNSLHSGEDAVNRAFDIWARGYARLSDLVAYDPVVLARAQTVLELVLVPLTFLVGYGAIKALRGHLKRRDGDPAGGTRGAVRALLGIGALAVLASVLLGAFNQIVELIILAERGSIGPLESALLVTGFVRTWLLPLALVAIVVGIVEVERAKPPDERLRWWRGTGTTYRILFVVVLLHAVLLLLSTPGAQSEDALRLWLQSPRLAVMGVGFTSILAVALATISIRIGTHGNPQRVLLDRVGTRRLVAVGVILLVAGLVARAFDQGWNAGAIGAGLIVLVVAALSLPLAPSTGPLPGSSSIPDPGALAKPSEDAMQLVPALLALAPLTVLTVALVRSSIPSIIDSQSSGWLIAHAAAAGVLAVIAFCLAPRRRGGHSPPLRARGVRAARCSSPSRPSSPWSAS